MGLHVRMTLQNSAQLRKKNFNGALVAINSAGHQMFGQTLKFASILAFGATAAFAGDFNLQKSVELLAEGTDVWHRIGDFCDIDDWHPGITACALKVSDGKLHRHLTTRDGASIVEVRIAEEAGLSHTYKLVSTTLPIDKYTATLAIVPGQGTRVIWSVRGTSADPNAESDVSSWYDSGLAAIEGTFSGN